MNKDLLLFITIMIAGAIAITSLVVFLINRNFIFLFFGVFMAAVVYIILLITMMRRMRK